MPESFAAHASQRDHLLNRIVEHLQHDGRFTAAWLAGSFGRGDADNLSDLDLVVVVADHYAEQLCRRDVNVGAGTTPERHAVISAVGTPAVIHENNHNAPAGGTFTAVIYADGVQQVDWTFVPRASACRTDNTLLLFEDEHVEACMPPTPLDNNARLLRLAERHAFFWIMVVPTMKYTLRGDAVYLHILMDMLDRTASEIEHLIQGESWTYQRGSRVRLAVAQADQFQALHAVVARIRSLEPSLSSLGITGNSLSAELIEFLTYQAGTGYENPR